MSLSGLSPDAEDECVERSRVCDNTRDCPFGDDEWNCNDELGLNCSSANDFYECFNSPRGEYLPTNSTENVCIRKKYSCLDGEDVWDCPNQEDLLPEICTGLIECMCFFCFVCISFRLFV